MVLGWMGFQTHRGTLSNFKVSQNPTRCQESTEVPGLQMMVEVVDIFSMVTFQIFKVLLKGRWCANTMPAFSLLLTCSK